VLRRDEFLKFEIAGYGKMFPKPGALHPLHELPCSVVVRVQHRIGIVERIKALVVITKPRFANGGESQSGHRVEHVNLVSFIK
jgi:hypothetical protein